MSFFGGGGGGNDYAGIPGYGNKDLKKFMEQWKKQQEGKQGLESTILTSWAGTNDTKPSSILGDAWIS